MQNSHSLGHIYGMIAHMDLFTILERVLYFLNYTIIPLIFTFAFFFFIFNAARYFIIGGANEDSREKAKSLAIWGIAAFVFIISIWGLVNVIGGGLGISFFRGTVTPDYIERSGVYGPGGASQGFDCTDIAFGFSWCSESGGTVFQHTPGTPPQQVNPNVSNSVFVPF